MLSHHEQRTLSEIERELSKDPALAKMAGRFATTWPHDRGRPPARVAWILVLVIEGAALGLVTVGASTSSQVDVLVGLLFAVVLGVPILGVATARHLDRRRPR